MSFHVKHGIKKLEVAFKCQKLGSLIWLYIFTASTFFSVKDIYKCIYMYIHMYMCVCVFVYTLSS